MKLPDADTVWTPAGRRHARRRPAGHADLGQRRGLEFRRTIAVDDKYLFTVEDEVANKGAAPVTLYPYALISRHGTPKTQGYYILHEGLIGVLGEQGLQEVTYKDDRGQEGRSRFKATNAWLGITDKYWAATLLPDTNADLQARFSAGTDRHARRPTRPTTCSTPQTIAPGATGARQHAAVRRRQGSRDRRRLRQGSSSSTASSC